MRHDLVVLGDDGVGKTELVNQFLGPYVEDFDPILEDTSGQKYVVVDGQPCVMHLIDFTGNNLKEYMALCEMYIRTGDGFVIVYSVTNRSSFEQVLEHYMQAMRMDNLKWPRAAPAIGNKSEETALREVSFEEGQTLAWELGCQFIETSARDLVNVKETFRDLVRAIRQTS
ncbi:P-loop containing nucleoside triphosphate hydrolase protein [Cercophora scortea]|uniref:P-loop containing nucleoside triphosphate hydrolase protein n=1 Tax=Cercophora scortea TaxID=314031 RepID=A0AAE0MHX9_9PEZI|nr:P-loop containing nucleoside triphosphate hydrolase protein [Cercophora scortea]